MDKVIYLNDLYDCYKELFTDKQRMYFEDYYFNNLSLSEIAENYKVSRNAVHNQLKIIVDKLEEFECKLQLLNKKKMIIKILDGKIKDALLENIKGLL